MEAPGAQKAYMLNIYVLGYSQVWKNYIVQMWVDLPQDSKFCILLFLPCSI
jgi:hypothetical protein